MTEPRWLNVREIRAWRGYQRMGVQLTAQLHRSLQKEAGLSLSDYEVLVHLSEADGGRLRSYELGSRLQWEKSRLSHHLSRMERRGLVTRETCESDARGLFVVITPRGMDTIEKAAPHHVDDVRDNLIDLLTPEELDVLADISERVLAQLDAGGEAESA
ncbi:MAG: MarR family transcriptional regulator [Acidimicrobiia bacterium]|nr:MarR family transcriptional regulator [Acidimicrobiia bacterium]